MQGEEADVDPRKLVANVSDAHQAVSSGLLMSKKHSRARIAWHARIALPDAMTSIPG
jgi:hypothetical protein